MKHIWFALCISVLPLSLLSGCATLSESECRNSDWYDIGFRDGRVGEPQDRVSRHAGACADHGVAPDRARYLEGHEAGIEHYCTQHNGLRAGESGASYQGVCPVGEEEAFLSGYQVGHALYRVRINLIGKLVGDRVFCYRRMTAEANRRDDKAAVDSAHANLAARN